MIPKTRGAPPIHGADLRWAAISCFSAPTIKPLAFDFDLPLPSPPSCNPKQTPAIDSTLLSTIERRGNFPEGRGAKTLAHAQVHRSHIFLYFHKNCKIKPPPPPVSRPQTIHPLPSNNLQQSKSYRPQVMLLCLLLRKLWKEHPGGLPGSARDLKDIKPPLQAL